jgi:sec-independent protein translocase protein TatA
MNIGTPELILIVVLAIILYGKRLPEITRALGKGYQEFKKNVDNVKNDFQKQVVDSDVVSKDVKCYSETDDQKSPEETVNNNQDKNLAG